MRHGEGPGRSAEAVHASEDLSCQGKEGGDDWHSWLHAVLVSAATSARLREEESHMTEECNLSEKPFRKGRVPPVAALRRLMHRCAYAVALHLHALLPRYIRLFRVYAAYKRRGIAKNYEILNVASQ